VYSGHEIERSCPRSRGDGPNRQAKTEALKRDDDAVGGVNTLRLFNIGTLVIGNNDGWKQAVKVGSRTDQNFVQIPHARFVEMLRYKARLAGIQVIVTEESSTSKCSFLDLEPIGKQETYAGKRVKRWLFVAGDGGKSMPMSTDRTTSCVK
jgi:IS605 OrfB family transposase